MSSKKTNEPEWIGQFPRENGQMDLVVGVINGKNGKLKNLRFSLGTKIVT